MSRVLVFDVDGVLVDVTGSYREAIRHTVAAFTGRMPSHEIIQDYKNQGGWNNDWKLTHRLIQDAGLNPAYEEVVRRFDELFMGSNEDGLICRERWVACDGLFDRLAARWRLAIFTSRHRYELDATLRRLKMMDRFDPIVTHELVTRHKPHPEGLHQIAQATACNELWYVGDTVDDAEAARAASLPFIGIAAQGNPRRADLVRALEASGARAVLEDINALETVLP